MSADSPLALAVDAAAPAPRAKRPVEFVRDDGTRAEGINALFNRFTGRSRSAAQYRW